MPRSDMVELCPECKGDTVKKILGGIKTCQRCDGYGVVPPKVSSGSDMEKRAREWWDANLWSILCSWEEARTTEHYAVAKVNLIEALEQAYREGCAEERERCAKVVDKWRIELSEAIAIAREAGMVAEARRLERQKVEWDETAAEIRGLE